MTAGTPLSSPNSTPTTTTTTPTTTPDSTVVTEQHSPALGVLMPGFAGTTLPDWLAEWSRSVTLPPRREATPSVWE